MKIIHTLAIVITFISSLQNIIAQENNSFKELNTKTYIIIDNGGVLDIQPYVDALNNSNMQNHRLKKERYIIAFRTGVKVELFSATEISTNGISININDYPLQFNSSRQEPIFVLGVDNFIIEYHTSGAKHH